MDIFAYWFYKRNSLKLITREFETAEGSKDRQSESTVGDKWGWIRSRFPAWLKQGWHHYLNHPRGQPSPDDRRTIIGQTAGDLGDR